MHNVGGSSACRFSPSLTVKELARMYKDRKTAGQEKGNSKVESKKESKTTMLVSDIRQQCVLV